MNEANDNLIIERSDEILEDTNEKYFMICTLFQTPKFLGEYVTGWQCFNWFGNFKESSSRVFQSHYEPDNLSLSLNVC